MTVLKVALITAEVHGKTSVNLNCCWSKPLMTMEAHIKNRESTAILVYFQAFCVFSAVCLTALYNKSLLLHSMSNY